jgi:hypothetical protein
VMVISRLSPMAGGGERAQVLFGELTGSELQLLLLRAEMKRDSHEAPIGRAAWFPQ